MALRKRRVFIPESIGEKFDEHLNTLSNVQVERQVNFNHRDMKGIGFNLRRFRMRPRSRKNWSPSRGADYSRNDLSSVNSDLSIITNARGLLRPD